jgi:endoribonuclease LACTB2
VPDHDPSVDALYEQVRKAIPAADGERVAGLTQVAPGIRVLALRTPTLPPAAHTNVYLIGPERGPQWIVDPGSPYDDENALLDRVLAAESAAGRPPSSILLTHHHGDHMAGAAALAARWRLTVAAHPLTARRVVNQVSIDRELVDGERLVAGELELTCLHTPGHADGHLCFEVGGAVVAGDMVAGVGTILIDPREGDMALYLASLERLLARRANTLLPAHGPAIPDGHGKLRAYIAHRLAREQLVIDALSARRDASIAELVPAVYADTPRLLWPLAERSLRAHVDKLVHEGRARAVDDTRWTTR